MNYGELKTAIQDYCENSETSFVTHIPDFVRSAEDKVFMAVEMPAFWKSNSSIRLRTGEEIPEYTMVPGVLDVLSVRIGETAVAEPEVVEDGPVRYLIKKDYSFLLEAYPGTSSAVTAGLPKYYAISSASGPESISRFGSFGSGSTLVSGLVTTSDLFPGMAISGTGIPSGTVIDYIFASVAIIMSEESESGESQNLTFSTESPSMTIRLGPIPDLSYPLTVDYYGKTAADSITNGDTDGNETWLSVTAPSALLYGSLVEAYIYMKGEPDLVQACEKQFMENLTLLKNMTDNRMESDDYRPRSSMGIA